MSLIDDLNEDITKALKADDKLKVLVLRMLKSAIHNEVIATRNQESGVNDDLALAVLKREVKKRREAIISYEQGGRDDLSQKEKQELEVLEAYLPPQLSEEMIEKIIMAELAKLPDSDKNFGQVMKRVMAAVKGQADGKLVGELVKKHL